MASARHRHTAVRSDPQRAFLGCVAPRNCNPRAHGWLTHREHCSCGRIRWVAENGRYTEASTWRLPGCEE